MDAVSPPDPALDQRPPWVAAMSDDQGFRAEQRALSRYWHFLGHERDLKRDGDWFRTLLGGEQIFVQRFTEGLRAFVNRCAHRFHPIRTERAGNGPIVCPFHEWRYDQTGLAYGIPKCREVFGKSPQELNARLKPVELATHAGLIFGRIGSDGPPLTEWLGPAAGILDFLGTSRPLRWRDERMADGHWKLLMEISLDDYHLVGVHPNTFGKGGYSDTNQLSYYHFPPHSAYFLWGGEDGMQTMAKECADGSFRLELYRIFQFFPNMMVILARSPLILGRSYGYMMIYHFEAVAHNRTRCITRFFALPGERGGDILRRFLMPFVDIGVWLYTRRVHSEDNACVAQLQKTAAGVNAAPLISAQEERVGWFDEDYARLVGAHRTDRTD